MPGSFLDFEVGLVRSSSTVGGRWPGINKVPGKSTPGSPLADMSVTAEPGIHARMPSMWCESAGHQSQWGAACLRMSRMLVMGRRISMVSLRNPLKSSPIVQA